MGHVHVWAEAHGAYKTAILHIAKTKGPDGYPGLAHFYHFHSKNGDPGGIRTHDNSIKSRVLYQLSYGITALE
jgi:hypothetical protein